MHVTYLFKTIILNVLCGKGFKSWQFGHQIKKCRWWQDLESKFIHLYPTLPQIYSIIYIIPKFSNLIKWNSFLAIWQIIIQIQFERTFKYYVVLFSDIMWTYSWLCKVNFFQGLINCLCLFFLQYMSWQNFLSMCDAEYNWLGCSGTYQFRLILNPLQLDFFS